MLKKFSLSTEKQGLYNVTHELNAAIAKSGAAEGIAVVWCPHTTAGITVNENADPDVVHDLLLGFDSAFFDRREFRHFEGNSAAHLKSSCVGAGQTLIIESGRLLLGRWQGVYFAEFDGPRDRSYYLKIIEG